MALTPRFRRSGIFPIKPVQVPGLAGATSKLGCRVKPPTYISQIMVFATGRPRGISLPSQRFGVDDHTLQRCRRVVRLSRRLPASPYRPGDAFPVRIEEHHGSGNVAPGPDGAGGVRAPFIQNPLLYPSNGESRSRGGHGRSLRRGRAHRPRPQMDANAGVQNFTIINATTVQPRAIWWP